MPHLYRILFRFFFGCFLVANGKVTSKPIVNYQQIGLSAIPMKVLPTIAHDGWSYSAKGLINIAGGHLRLVRFTNGRLGLLRFLCLFNSKML